MSRHRLDILVSRQVVRWLVAITLVLFVVLTALLLVLTWQSDRRQGELLAGQLLRQEQQNQRVLADTSREFASWDDMYAYVRAPREKLEIENFSARYQMSNQVNFTVILGAAHEVLFASEQESVPDSEEDVVLPVHNPALLPAILALPIRQSLEPGAPQAFYRMLAGRPVLLVASAISSTDERAPGSGVLVMGRYLDGAYALGLAEPFDLRARFVARPAEGRDWSVRGVGWSQRSYLSVQGGDTPMWLEAHQTFEWQQRLLTLLIVLVAIAGLVLLMGAALRQALRHHVIRRVEEFAWRATFSPVTSQARWPSRGENELDDLADAFNALLDRVTQVQRALDDQAHTDTLTRLGNRRALEREFQTLQANRSEECCSMLLLDLDGFKQVNDTFGHAVGDELLQEVAERMEATMRGADRLFRLGGDEFAVLLPGTPQEQAYHLGERLLERINEPYLCSGNTLRVSVSIGAAQALPVHGETLMHQADVAMYAAKYGGKSRVRTYEPSLEQTGKPPL